MGLPRPSIWDTTCQKWKIWFSGSTGSGNPNILADSERACQDLLFEIHTTCQKISGSGFSRFPDQPDTEIWKFLQISNGLAKTVNLIYYLQKVIFGAPDGPDPPDGAGAGAGGHLGRGPRIKSSSGGQDEAIDTPSILLRPLDCEK